MIWVETYNAFHNFECSCLSEPWTFSCFRTRDISCIVMKLLQPRHCASQRKQSVVSFKQLPSRQRSNDMESRSVMKVSRSTTSPCSITRRHLSWVSRAKALCASCIKCGGCGQMSEESSCLGHAAAVLAWLPAKAKYLYTLACKDP